MIHKERGWFVDAAALLALPSCGFAVAGDAQADCDRLVAILSEVGLRCAGHALAPDVLRCDEIALSGMTSDDVDECRHWAEAVDCESLRAYGARPKSAGGGLFGSLDVRASPFLVA